MEENTRPSGTWQEKLAESCKDAKYTAPVYNIISDRRGGRTAWSASVIVNSKTYAARYWYDGQFLNNAKEDAAEVAWTKVFGPISVSLQLCQEKQPNPLVDMVAGSDIEKQLRPWHGRFSGAVYTLLLLVLVLMMVVTGLGASFYLSGHRI